MHDSDSIIPVHLANDLAIQSIAMGYPGVFKTTPLKREGNYWLTYLSEPKLIGPGPTKVSDDGLVHQFGSAYVFREKTAPTTECDCGRCKLRNGTQAHFFKHAFQQRDMEQSLMQSIESQYTIGSAKFGIGLLTLCRFLLFCGEPMRAMEVAMESLQLQEMKGKPDAIRYIDTLGLLWVLLQLTGNPEGSNEVSGYLKEEIGAWFKVHKNTLRASGHTGNLCLVNFEFNSLQT